MREATLPATDDFKRSLEPFLQTWKSLEVRAIADYQGSVLLSLVACLTTDEPKPMEVIDAGQAIGFIKGEIPSSELIDLLEQIDSGLVQIGDFKLDTTDFSNPRFERLQTDRPSDLIKGWPEYEGHSYFPLNWWGSQNLESITQGRDTDVARLHGFGNFAGLAFHRAQFLVGSRRVKWCKSASSC